MPSLPFSGPKKGSSDVKTPPTKVAFWKGISTNLLYRRQKNHPPVQTGKAGRSLQKEDRVGLGALEALCLHKEDHSRQHRQAFPAPSLACPPQARQGAARLSSCFSSSGRGGPDVQEPGPLRGSQAVQTLTHSCLEQRRGLSPPFLLRKAGMPTGSGGD